MKNNVLLLKLLTFILGMIILTGCPDDKPSKPSDNDNINVKELKEININSTSRITVSEPFLGGCVIDFPSGGNGLLKIGKIDKSPEIPSDEHYEFFLEYSGDDKVQLIIPYDSSNFYGIQYLGKPIGAYRKNVDLPNWYGLLPTNKKNDSLYFEINAKPAPKPNSIRIQSYTPPAANYFSYNLINAGTTNWQKHYLMYNTIREIAKLWTNQLPANIADNLKRRMSGDYLFDIRSSRNSSYNFLNNWVWGKNCVFNLRTDIELDVVAHEVGHYMTHVMGGYDRMNEIYNRMPQDIFCTSLNHEYGFKYNNRNCFLEEYAHMSMFLHDGTVGKWDIYNTNYNMAFTTALKTDNFGGYDGYQQRQNNPAIIDYPSTEGFAMLCVGSLLRSESKNKIYKWNETDRNKTSTVPALNVPISDIITHLFYPCPVSFTEFHTLVVNYLNNKKGGAQKGLEKFYVNMEPLGWTYFGKVKLVDYKGNPVKRIKAIDNCIIISPNEIYKTIGTTLQTSETGEYTFQRLFPGKSTLRIQYEKGGILTEEDISIEIDPTKPTNQQIDLGEIKINILPDDLGFKKIDLNILVYCTERTVCGENVSTFDAALSFQTIAQRSYLLTRSGNNFSSQWNFERVANDFYKSAYVGELNLTINSADNTYTLTFSQTEYTYRRENTSNDWSLDMKMEQSISTKPTPLTIYQSSENYKWIVNKYALGYFNNISAKVTTTGFIGPKCVKEYINFQNVENTGISMVLSYKE